MWFHIIFLTFLFFSKNDANYREQIKNSLKSISYVFGCPKANGAFGDLDSCNKFYLCSNRKPILMNCPENQEWNSKKRQCVSKENSDCANNFDCPKPMGLFANPIDCSSFFYCAYNLPYIIYCPMPLQWSSKSNRCEWPENSDCYLDVSNATSERSPESQLGDLTDNNSFTNPTEQTINKSFDFECKVETGFFENAQDPSKYYICLGFQAFEKKCPAGKIFDATTRGCINKELLNINKNVNES